MVAGYTTGNLGGEKNNRMKGKAVLNALKPDSHAKVLLYIFLIALAFRLWGVTNPLLDFHSWRQTLTATKERGELTDERLTTRLGELQALIERMATIVKQVASVVEYRTIDYVGDTKIIDLESSQGPRRQRDI